MLLDNNGRASSGKRTMHTNIIYLFISERVNPGEVNIKYWPTDNIIGDYFTKPLQGPKSRNFKGYILNIQINDGRTFTTIWSIPYEFV